MYRELIKDSERIVIKVGTSTLTHDNGKLNLRRIGELCRVITDLHNAGRDIVLVTSGAIGVGMGKLGVEKRPVSRIQRQALAAVGQCELMFIYDKLFGEFNQTVAQVLVNAEAVDETVSRQNVLNTFEQLLEIGVIPIVNENDTVGTAELDGHSIGDNDTLSAIVATLIDADVLAILTDIDGLYDKNPAKDPTARLIPEVPEITQDIIRLAGKPGSRLGTGGMATKVSAAGITTDAGSPCCVISGADTDNLYRLFDGAEIGTLFLPKE
jgi:glutamate 5-kinase